MQGTGKKIDFGGLFHAMGKSIGILISERNSPGLLIYLYPGRQSAISEMASAAPGA